MVNPFKKKVRLVTHGSSFHADDIFATALLRMYFRETENRGVKVIRTRDPKIIATGDIVYDVGDIYDPENNRFDHHQSGGAGNRENGVPYSSFGLTWKHFGSKLVSEEIHKDIDEQFVQHICATDNGYIVKLPEKDWKIWTFDGVFKLFRPEHDAPRESWDAAFLRLTFAAEEFLVKLIEKNKKQFSDYKKVEEIYNNTKDKRIIVLDKGMSWHKVLISKPEPIYVISPTSNQNDFHVNTVPVSEGTYKNRKSFPEAWCGQRDEELEKISGIAGAIFVHRGGFLGVAKTLDAAIEMAQKALEL